MTERPANWVRTVTHNYIELYKCEQNGDYERGLKICNKIYHNYPDELLAFHCKVICLIHLSKFEEALQFMKNNAYSKKNLSFERAYCLYRCNKSQDALAVIDDTVILTYRLRELKAQILYRTENFSESFEIYKEISKVADDDYVDERHTNMGAALVYSKPEEIKDHIENIREGTYELSFNRACLLLALGQYPEAERKLRQCEKLCRDALEEDGLSEEEIQVELAHVKIQLAYIYHKQGRIREAQQLYVTNLKLKLEDPALVAVASNNAVIINKDQNVFDSKRKMKVATNEALIFKLTTQQRKLILLNKAMLHFYTNQHDTCKSICDSLDKTWPDMNLYTSIINALILFKHRELDEALDVLKKCKTKNEEENLILQLTSAQLWLMQGDRIKACTMLENTQANRHRPGIVGALITLYSAENKQDIAQKIYKETVEWYKENKKTEGDLTNLWKQAAEFHLRRGQAHVAAYSFEELLKKKPDDKRTLGKLILAYSEYKKKEAISLANTLFTTEDLYEGLDVETVESSVWLSSKKVPPSNSPAVSATPSSESLNIVKKKKHRRRKGKLPKNCDSNVLPDPERWLPKYERTGFRKKRDRRAKDIIKGSQGTASGQAELFDFSNKLSNEAEPQEATSVEPSPVAKHQPKNKGQKKKNKRR